MGSGKPWSTLDLNNLREGLRAGMPIPKLASFLIREVDEVEAKIAELALLTRQQYRRHPEP